MERVPIPEGLTSLHCIVLVHLKYHRRELYRSSSSYLNIFWSFKDSQNICDISPACAIKCILDIKGDYRTVFFGSAIWCAAHCFVPDFTNCEDSICCWSAAAKSKLVVRYGMYLLCVFFYSIANYSLENFSCSSVQHAKGSIRRWYFRWFISFWYEDKSLPFAGFRENSILQTGCEKFGEYIYLFLCCNFLF